MFAFAKKLFQHQTDHYPVLQAIQEDTTGVHSPDILLLEQKLYHLVFLYCDRQYKHPREMKDVDHLWTAETQRPYLLWKHDLGKLSYPIATKALFKHRRIPVLPIRGEIVKMSTAQLVELDREKRNRVQFNRVRVPLTVTVELVKDTQTRIEEGLYSPGPYLRGDKQKQRIQYNGEAWMYVGHSPYWLELIDGGFNGIREATSCLPNKVKAERGDFTNEGKYYHFPPTEYPS